MAELKSLSKEEIEAAFKYQKENIDWTFYSEREFIENLFNQRFNYLIVMYSLFIAAATTVHTKENLLIVLTLGLVFTSLVSLTIYRAYMKLIIILKILHRLDNHIFQLIEKEVSAMGRKALFGVNQITGIYIPLIAIITFATGILLTAFNVLQP